MIRVARRIKASGATLLRGGAFKPRTSPYDFQGLHAEGLRLLKLAKEETGLSIVTEIMNASDLPLFEDVDVIQVGARNMQNFDLLKALGHTDKVILLKRGLSGTLKELLMSAEYIMSGGNEQVILCDPGHDVYEEIAATLTRQMLNIAIIGMPSSGKTAVGQALATLCGRPFVDTDTLVEARLGLPIPALIVSKGEAAFRELESAMLADAAKESGTVIATGGGIVIVPRNQHILRRNCRVLHLYR
ncbi:MAG: hypothetical protein GX810_09940, partial [Clostridiales bacterium]|nr:hypothetical protein [Clostridiales bacterium]